MERRTTERASNPPRRDERPRPPERRDDPQRARLESHDIAEERTLEEAGYGYGV